MFLPELEDIVGVLFSEEIRENSTGESFSGALFIRGSQSIEGLWRSLVLRSPRERVSLGILVSLISSAWIVAREVTWRRNAGLKKDYSFNKLLENDVICNDGFIFANIDGDDS